MGEPRIAPPVREIWAHLAATRLNVEAMLANLLEDAGMPGAAAREVPEGFGETG